ncbi:peptide chain release factor N(5)-glutamine methyltransferase [Mycoplasma sp. 2704]|uniref:peptide chain release factor N(5)-glutamine methyltransferase n=1 Tax=unclassified Mycoplasma TaxID=2683645 RepID=UPI002B1D8000|nr:MULTISPECIES: peptide chain release factor N(5)-glutamine methyltransferase [unclassified Mycoplasma]MEA4134232.1 peptide chain release factor N(5)-glutamine methyltransferase [Mycoplasma sp. 2704]MEA4333542.1 peptide chain release factor N(5)-glutamine methyltransferase [Mycoplasma sp. 1232]
MPTREDLLLEKRRYGLEQTVSSFELEQLQKGMPVQKIMGYVELADVTIDVSKKVLIPRYETEELVILVNSENKKQNLDVLDLCTGSGFIAIALKKANPTWNITASDIDSEAIEQTKINAQKNDVTINIIQSDMFENINQKFDLIVSNPPYIQETEILDKSVTDWEPLHALYAKDDGFYFYDLIINNAENYLKPGGKIYFEINPFHIKYWEKLQEKYKITIHKDMSSKNRFAVIEFD